MRRYVGWASVALLVIPSAVAIPFTPVEAHAYMVIAFVATVAFAIQAAVSEPKDLLIALPLALAPVVALVGEGSPTWLMGPLTVAILMGAELNAVVWASQGSADLDAIRRRRLTDTLLLGGVALVGTLVLVALSGPWAVGNATSWLIAIGAITGLGRLTFRTA